MIIPNIWEIKQWQPNHQPVMVGSNKNKQKNPPEINPGHIIPTHLWMRSHQRLRWYGDFQFPCWITGGYVETINPASFITSLATVGQVLWDLALSNLTDFVV